MLSDYLTPAQLADDLGICAKTLERWRNDGQGPPITRLGRTVLYRRTSVAAWLTARELQAA
jgi:predicted site-specific integrase-resolvase